MNRAALKAIVRSQHWPAFIQAAEEFQTMIQARSLDRTNLETIALSAVAKEKECEGIARFIQEVERIGGNEE